MKRPAVMISLGYAAGIVIKVYFNWYLFVLLLLGGILIFLYYKEVNRWRLFFLIIILGTSFIHLSILTLYEQRVDHLIHGTEKNIIVSVKEVRHLNSAIKIVGKIKEVNGNSVPIFSDCRAMITVQDKIDVHLGDTLSVNGKIKSIKKPTNLGQFNQHSYYNARKIYYSVYVKKLNIIKHSSFPLMESLISFRRKLMYRIEQLFPEIEAGIIKTMLLGEKGDLDDEIKETYKRAGISHLLAISGLHVTIIGAGIYKLLKKLSEKKGLNATIVIGFLSVYCMLTGGSISTVRATIMFVTMVIGEVSYRKYDSLSGIGLAAFILLVNNPYQLFDVGFLLSFGAVLGIVVVSPILEKKYTENGNSIFSLFFATLGANSTTLPIIIYFFYQVPIYALLTNMAILPFVTLMMYLSILGIAISYLFFPIGQVLCYIAVYLLGYFQKLGEWVQFLPWHLLVVGKPALYMLVIYYSLLVCLLIKSKYRWAANMEIVLFVIVGIIILYSYCIKPVELLITCLDVGQGDCAVLEYDKKVFVIDGGGNRSSKSKKNTGYYTLNPYLMAKGYHKVDGVFVSHSDFDHMCGIIEIMDTIPIDFIALPYPYAKEKDELIEMLEKKSNEKGIDIVYLKAGDTYQYKDLIIRCLYPFAHTTTFETNNDKSNVLLVQYGQFDMLFTGDIEKTGEEALVASREKLGAEVIKVPHHGSKTSSTEAFIKKVSPLVAIMSYGENNYFGHPNKEVVERYASIVINQYHIAKEGAVEIKVNHNFFEIHCFYTDRKEHYQCKN